MTHHDRTGERIDDSVVASEATPDHDPRCRKGFLGEELDGRPIPCLQCRPHLRKTATANDHSLWR